MTTLQTDTLVDQYFHEIEDSVGLSAEDEIKIAKKIQLGDEKALTELVKANLRFVVSVAKQYQNLGLPLSDLINEGNLGLIIAAKRFDGTKGFFNYLCCFLVIHSFDIDHDHHRAKIVLQSLQTMLDGAI